MPIAKTAIALKKASSGEEFEIVSDDPGFEPDITGWCDQTGNALKEIRKDGRDITAVVAKK
jgi:TusA-related sulfurtransferase